MGKFIIATILTGIITGIFVVIYSLLTKLLNIVLFLGYSIEDIDKLPWWYLYLVPMISILIVNYLISKNNTLKEYGISEIAKAIEENKITFSIKDLFLKIIASSLSLASGFAVGNEGPSAAIGAMISQKIHNFFKLPKTLLRVSLSIGASSGIAAIFVSPITAIMFAIENIAYEFVKNYAGYLMLASVVSFSIAYHFLESLVFNYSIGKFIEYRYIFATFIFIPVITIFIYLYLSLKDKVLQFLNEKFSKYRYKNIVFAIVGGGVIGSFLNFSPYAVFSGHELVNNLINSEFELSFGVILILILFRIVATAVSIYANAVGGIFIALMSIGALVGYGFGELMVNFGIIVEPFYFSAIGAAVFMGVNMKLPLTAIVLALEITYDYNVIIPTGFSVVIVSYLASLKFDIKKLSFKGKR